VHADGNAQRGKGDQNLQKRSKAWKLFEEASFEKQFLKTTGKRSEWHR